MRLGAGRGGGWGVSVSWPPGGPAGGRRAGWAGGEASRTGPVSVDKMVRTH